MSGGLELSNSGLSAFCGSSARTRNPRPDAVPCISFRKLPKASIEFSDKLPTAFGFLQRISLLSPESDLSRKPQLTSYLFVNNHRQKAAASACDWIGRPHGQLASWRTTLKLSSGFSGFLILNFFHPHLVRHISARLATALDLLASGDTLTPACCRQLGDKSRFLELGDGAEDLAHDDRSR